MPIFAFVVIGFGLLFVVAGLLPGSFWRRIWALGYYLPSQFAYRVTPVVGRLALIIFGLIFLGLADLLQAASISLRPSIDQGTYQLTTALYDAVGPVGVIVIGLVLVGAIVAILRYRRVQRHRIPFGVQRQPPRRQSGQKKLVDLFVEEATLEASGTVVGDSFGATVAVSNHTIIGMSRKNTAYVFVRQESTPNSWNQQADLTTTDGATKVNSPRMAISGDRVVIGTEAKPVNTPLASVFVRKGTTWQQEAQLTVADGAGMTTVAMSDNTIAVGTYDKTKKAGAVYIFALDGSIWQQQTRLETAGGTVAFQNDTLVVGATGGYREMGLVEVFVRQGLTWQPQARLEPADRVKGSGFGSAVAISADTIVCGAPDHFRTIGAAYVFVRDGTQWKQQALLVPADRYPGTFGFAVAIDGDTIAVGAPLKADAIGFLHLFVREGTSWIENVPLTYSKRARQDHFGNSIGVHGDTIVVGVQPVPQFAVFDAKGAVLMTVKGDANFAVGKVPNFVPAADNIRSRGFAVVFARRNSQ